MFLSMFLNWTITNLYSGKIISESPTSFLLPVYKEIIPAKSKNYIFMSPGESWDQKTETSKSKQGKNTYPTQ